MSKNDICGTYFGVYIPDSVKMGTTKAMDPIMFLDFAIDHIANPESENGWEQLEQQLTRSVSILLSEKAWEYSVKKLEHFGFNGDFENPAFTDIPEDGIELVCEERNGYKNWDFGDLGIFGREITPPEMKTLQLLTARFKKGGNDKPSGSPKTPPPAKPRLGGEAKINGDDDKLPFD